MNPSLYKIPMSAPMDCYYNSIYNVHAVPASVVNSSRFPNGVQLISYYKDVSRVVLQPKTNEVSCVCDPAKRPVDY